MADRTVSSAAREAARHREDDHLMKSAHIKAARAALGWTQEELARRAKVHPKSIAYWEARDGGGHPRGAVAAIRHAFEQAGIIIESGSIRIC
jgi:DNA-binding transcriptional regulator YiaG